MGRILVLVVFAWLALAKAGAVDYPVVEPGRGIALPADGGAHPEYRSEWWYVTGWLTDEEGRERGFQLTFFRVRSGHGEDSAGRFSPAQLILAHAAIADPREGRLLHAQHAARASGRIAGARRDRAGVWLRDWSLAEQPGGFEAVVDGEAFGYRLTLRGGAEPMLNGEQGFSRKGAGPREASYYYSLPQLEVAGELRLSGRVLKVGGRAWLDHEWSSEYLPADAVGWDWVGLNLDDGGAVMAFRMRDREGRTLWSAGTLRDATGAARALAPDEVRFHPGRSWTSPRSGARYPVEWRIELGARVIDLRPLMDDQELDARATAGAVYWEGAVRVLDGERAIGRGYLEMTGYAGRVPL